MVSIQRKWTHHPGRRAPTKCTLRTVDSMHLNLAGTTKTVKVGDMVTIDHCDRNAQDPKATVNESALVRRLFERVDGKKVTRLLHCQFLLPRGNDNDATATYDLQDGRCITVRSPYVTRKIGGGKVGLVATTDGAWRDPVNEGLSPRDMHADPFRKTRCDSCILRRKPSEATDGQRYHAGDLVFFASPPGLSSVDAVWECGIVITVDTPNDVGRTIKVRLCGRYDDLHGPASKNGRSLYLSPTLSERYVADIVGKGILNVDGHPDSFFCEEKLPQREPPLRVPPHVEHLRPISHDFKLVCDPCHDAAVNEARDLRAFDDLRLGYQDLYAGGGGSVLGASRSFKVDYVVDSAGVCGDTLKANVDLLKRPREHRMHVRHGAVADYTAGCLWGINGERGGRANAEPGSIAVLMAGPPCQGHSGANHSRGNGRHDERNDELGHTLSEIDRVRPDVAVIENVPGIAQNNTGPNGHHVNYVHDLVTRLRGLGYQVRVGLLNAAHYGAPQDRLRIFVMAARSGVTLPDWPAATHAGRVQRTNLKVDGRELRFDALRAPQLGSGPLRGVTCWDAISDLPPWSYRWDKNGALSYPPVWSTLPPAPPDAYVGERNAAYADAPQNEFQRVMRAGAGAGPLDHVTPPPTASEQNIMRARMCGLATTKDPGVSSVAPKGAPVTTLLTHSRVGGKTTNPMHPIATRTFTVAERKRFQGFPDAYKLRGTVDDKDSMLGNAVNVHLADALFRQIKRDVYFKAWVAGGRKGTREFWEDWRKMHPVQVQVDGRERGRQREREESVIVLD